MPSDSLSLNRRQLLTAAIASAFLTKTPTVALADYSMKSKWAEEKRFKGHYHPVRFLFPYPLPGPAPAGAHGGHRANPPPRCARRGPAI